MIGKGLVVLAALVAFSEAFTINFVNNCAQTVWPAVGLAPNGQPDPSFSWGQEVAAGASASVQVDDHAIGVRAWGRTGCDSTGANCQTGACNGGLVCNDAGITSNAIVSEYGYANFGAQYGGERTSWDLSHVGLDINLDTQLSCSDSQTVTCTNASCPSDQAYDSPTDYSADRNSALGQTFTHTFCFGQSPPPPPAPTTAAPPPPPAPTTTSAPPPPPPPPSSTSSAVPTTTTAAPPSPPPSTSSPAPTTTTAPPPPPSSSSSLSVAPAPTSTVAPPPPPPSSSPSSSAPGPSPTACTRHRKRRIAKDA